MGEMAGITSSVVLLQQGDELPRDALHIRLRHAVQETCPQGGNVRPVSVSRREVTTEARTKREERNP